MCVYHVYSWCPRKPEAVLDPLEPELLMVVSHHVGVENWMDTGPLEAQ